MKTVELFNFLKTNNIHLELDNGNIILNAEKGELNPGIVTTIKENKEELIRLLQGNRKSYFLKKINISEKKEYYKLSSSQMRMYILQNINKDSITYNEVQKIELGSNIDSEKLENSLQKLINRHEALRTSIKIVNGVPAQFIHNFVDFSIEHYNVNNSEEADCITNNFNQPFDLSKPPFLRAALIGSKDKKSTLLLGIHHIITDNISKNIFIEEIQALYNNKELPETKLQYKDYSEWHNFNKSKAIFKNQEAYWLNKLSGELPMLNLPIDYSRPKEQSFEGGNVHFILETEKTIMLRNLANNLGVTPYIILMSAYNIFLSKISGQEDIIVGCPVGGRPLEELYKVIGIFINTLPIRNYPTGEKIISEFIKEVGSNTLSAFENQDYPLEEIIMKLPLPRDANRNPVFDTTLNYLQAVDSFKIAGINNDDIHNEKTQSKFDISLLVNDKKEILEFVFEYCSKLFNYETIIRFLKYFKRTLYSIIENQQQYIWEIEIISEAEKHQLLYEFNNTTIDYPKEKTVLELFEEQVERSPDNIALIYKDHLITYNELNKKSNQIARVLQEKGVVTDTIVGLMIERSLEMIIGIYGILKSGGAYLPVDFNNPKERIQYFLLDSASKILLTQTKYKDWIPGIESIDIANQSNYTSQSNNIGKVNCPEDIMYVIYTSGSTGEPKGVMIEHHSLVNRLNWMQKFYRISFGDVILQKTPIAFDVSMWELFWWSFTGASLCLLKAGGEKEPGTIIKAIEKNKVTTIHFVPSMLDVFLSVLDKDFDHSNLSSLRHVFSSGEALKPEPVNLFAKLINKNCGTRLINLYGPTEATVDVSNYECKFEEECKTVPIGKPIDNIKLYILDKKMKLVPIGVTGELYIAGAGLARGYLRNKTQTANKFLDNPLFPKELMYKTGDLTRWLSDGNIEFLGRIDDQIKIRGYRIELKEIESILIKNSSVKEAAVIACDKGQNNKILAAFIVLSDKSMGKLKLKKYLRSKLPDYMIPSAIVIINEMPLTLNGKIDRKALSLKLSKDPQENENYIEPTTELEKQIASIWQELLGIEKVGLNDTFFDLGGHSLSIIQSNTRMKALFNIEIPFEMYFNQTFEQIVNEVNNRIKQENALIIDIK